LIDHIEQEDLDVMQCLECGSHDPGVPHVQFQSDSMVAARVREVRRQPGVGDPS
jgi:hypothetical protein